MSKGLEAFDELMSVYFDNETVKRKYGITEETAREKREIIEKELKALEIIEDKDVDIAWLKRRSPTLEDYNKAWCIGAKDLTQGEFDLLKEVLP